MHALSPRWYVGYGQLRRHFARAEKSESFCDFFRRARNDEGVSRIDLEVWRRSRVRRLASHNSHHGQPEESAISRAAEGLAGDVVFVVDSEPVDAQPGNLI